MILAGDIGGTKTTLAFFHTEGDIAPLWKPPSPAANTPTLMRLSANLCQHTSYPSPTPVSELPDRSSTDAVRRPTCRGWWMHCLSSSKLGLSRVGLINDLEANAYGIAALAPKDFIVLNQGEPEAGGNAAIISAGTGRRRSWSLLGWSAAPPICRLMVVMLTLHQGMNSRWNCCATCCSNSPALVGSGFFPDRVFLNVYRFLRDTGRDIEPSWLTEELRHQDPPTVIAKVALAGKCAL